MEIGDSQRTVFFCFDIPQIAALAFPAPLAALATAACRCLVGGTLSGAECAAVKSLVVEDKPREQGKSQSEKTARKLRRPTLDGQLGCTARTRSASLTSCCLRPHWLQ